MIGIVVQLAISWLIIWLYQKVNLEVLGIKPTGKRVILFFLFFITAAACAASAYVIRIYAGKEEWIINAKLTAGLFFRGLWWNIKSVLFEELIFRGVLFYILFKKLGAVKAIIISAAAFGIYHWFSQNTFGNPVQMLVTFLVTGSAGLLYGYAYVRTGSIYTPVAIHLGWNFTKLFVFSEGLIGNGLFILEKQPLVTVSYIMYLGIIWLPIVSFLVFNYLLLRSKSISRERLL